MHLRRPEISVRRVVAGHPADGGLGPGDGRQDWQQNDHPERHAGAPAWMRHDPSPFVVATRTVWTLGPRRAQCQARCDFEPDRRTRTFQYTMTGVKTTVGASQITKAGS